MKNKNYDTVHIVASKVDGELIKVTVKPSSFSLDNIGTFYVPTSSLDRFSAVPAIVLRARIKHDFKVEFEHYTYSNQN